MKHRSKLFLSILLSLVMMLGLMPGMSLTAYAAGTLNLKIYDELENVDDLSWSLRSGDVSIAEGTYVQITIGTMREATMQIWMNGEVVYTKPASNLKGQVIYSFTAGKNCKILGGYENMFDWGDYGPGNPNIRFTMDPAHTHSFTYSASGETITAECTATGCTLPPSTQGGTNHVATLTIAAPALTIYGGTGSAEATITDANSIRGTATLQYQTKSGDTYGTATTTAPTNAGTHKASITLGTGDNSATASVEYTIAKADPTATAPTASATYGQTLANVTLTNPEGNTAGTWAFVDAGTTSVGGVGSHTFKANFTPSSANYKTVENVDVTVTVGKAANPATVTSTASVTKGGNTVDLSANVTKNGATGDVTYAISGSDLDCTVNDTTGVFTSGDTAGDVTVQVRIAADDNYNALATQSITVTINDKQTQTITAENVTANYGDTDKKVTATTDGNGEISYAVKDGSGDYIDVNASTGALTIKKVGTATVVVTAAETAAYAQATKEVTVTINKANAVAATVTANNRTYDGTEKPLVTVTGTPTGGEMQYALGTATVATEQYTTSIPAKTEAGTYYVWYKAVGDENHNDSAAECVTVTVGAPSTLSLNVHATDVAVNGTVAFYATNGTGDKVIWSVTGRDKDAVKLYKDADCTVELGPNATDALTVYAKGITPGRASVTIASSADSGKSDTCNLTVAYTVSLVGCNNAALALAGDTAAASHFETWLKTPLGIGKLLSGEYGSFTLVCSANSGFGFKEFTPITLSGVTITRVSDTQLTITGEPTANVKIKVPDAGVPFSQTVTFKVVNGSWNDGEGDAATADRTVTLKGYQGDTLKLTEKDIPAVGGRPNDAFKAGSWDVTPTTKTAITGDTAFTYTYVPGDSVSHTVTFKVVNGAWNDGTAENETVTLTDGMKLSADQIPAVGAKPADAYKAGSWDVTPDTETAITGDTAFTYAYAPKGEISVTVTLKVVNGTWGDGTREDKTIVLTGNEGDELRLEMTDIPQVTKPDEGFEFGSGTWTPEEPPINYKGMTFGAPITENTTYTFTYGIKSTVIHLVTFKVVSGAWDDGTTDDRIVMLTGGTEDTLKLIADQIPAVGNKPAENFKAGGWDVTPTTETAVTGDITYTYTYAAAQTPIVYTQVNQDQQQSSLRIIFKRSENDQQTYSLFRKALVDGRELTDGKDFTKAPGSLILTLNAAYLDKLSAGEHTLTVLFADGQAESRFTVSRAKDPAKFEDVAVESDSFTFKVVWQGGSDKDIDFTLYKKDGTVYRHGFDKKKLGSGEWRYSAWFSSPEACYVIEKPMQGYQIRYENVGVYAGVTDRCCDGGTITIHKVPKTGDTANPALWMSMIVIGAMTLCGMAVMSKRRKKSEK